MTDKELIRRALMGSREAQRACTDKGIALPCPFCGGTGDNVALQNNLDSTQFWGYCWGCHAEGPIAHGSVKNALSIWNTRPAPPVRRCKDCKSYTALGHCKVHSQEPDQYGAGAYVEMLPDDFCSYFEPKED